MGRGGAGEFYFFITSFVVLLYFYALIKIKAINNNIDGPSICDTGNLASSALPFIEQTF